MARIVTTTYRYKRPPKKKRPVTLEVPVIVAPRKRARPPADGQSQPEPAALAPAKDDRKPAIVAAKRPGRRKASAWVDDGKSNPEIREWLERVKWGRGPSR